MGAWIEISISKIFVPSPTVAPLVGAWIEILEIGQVERGAYVAPLVGAWIEIFIFYSFICSHIVAPLVGAWIEIMVRAVTWLFACLSLPLWERGLKSTSPVSCALPISSLPLWERGLKYEADNPGDVPVHRRSPCGSVD